MYILPTYTRPCVIDGCKVRRYCRQYCATHYRMAQRGELPMTPKQPNGKTPIPVATRLWARVRRKRGRDGCWEWTGAKDRGYGKIGVPGGPPQGTHRVAWEDAHGPIPAGMFVCHRCDNPPCCRPSHLFLGTNDDNRRDSVAKGRHAHGEGNRMSKLTVADVHDIRRRMAAGESYKALGAEYGIHPMHCYNIASRKTWRHV